MFRPILQAIVHSYQGSNSRNSNMFGFRLMYTEMLNNSSFELHNDESFIFRGNKASFCIETCLTGNLY